MLDTVMLSVGCSGYRAYSGATLVFQAPVTLNLKKKILLSWAASFGVGFA